MRFFITLCCSLLTWAAHAQHAVVLNSRDATYSIIDIKADKVIATKPTGKEPHHLYPSPDGSQVWIANAQSDDLLQVNPVNGDVLQRIKNIPDPYQLAFSDDKQWFVTISLRLDRVDLYKHSTRGGVDEFKLIKRIPTGRMPSHVVFSQDNRFIFVTIQADDALLAIDLSTQSVAWQIPIGKTPAGVWLTPKGLVLVGIMGSDHVAVVDPALKKIVKVIPTGKGAHAFRGQGDGKTVFVGNRDQNTVSAIDMDSLTKLYDINTLSGPDCMDVSADGKMLWVTNRWARSVSAIDIGQKRIQKTYRVGSSPHGIYLTQRAAFK